MPRRRGRAPTPLAADLEIVHAGYAAKLANMTLSDHDTRAVYASRVRVRQYLACPAHTDVDGDPLADPATRYGGHVDPPRSDPLSVDMYDPDGRVSINPSRDPRWT